MRRVKWTDRQTNNIVYKIKNVSDKNGLNVQGLVSQPGKDVENNKFSMHFFFGFLPLLQLDAAAVWRQPLSSSSLLMRNFKFNAYMLSVFCLLLLLLLLKNFS